VTRTKTKPKLKELTVSIDKVRLFQNNEDQEFKRAIITLYKDRQPKLKLVEYKTDQEVMINIVAFKTTDENGEYVVQLHPEPSAEEIDSLINPKKPTLPDMPFSSTNRKRKLLNPYNEPKSISDDDDELQLGPLIADGL